MWLPWWLRQLTISQQSRRLGFDPWVRKIPCRRERFPPFRGGAGKAWLRADTEWVLKEDSPGGLGESESRIKDRAGDSSKGNTCLEYLSDIPVLHLSDPHSPQVMTFLAQRSHRSPIFLLQLLWLQQRTWLCSEHHWQSPVLTCPGLSPSQPASHQWGTPLPTPASGRRKRPSSPGSNSRALFLSGPDPLNFTFHHLTPSEAVDSVSDTWRRLWDSNHLAELKVKWECIHQHSTVPGALRPRTGRVGRGEKGGSQEGYFGFQILPPRQPGLLSFSGPQP